MMTVDRLIVPSYNIQVPGLNGKAALTLRSSGRGRIQASRQQFEFLQRRDKTAFGQDLEKDRKAAFMPTLTGKKWAEESPWIAQISRRIPSIPSDSQ
jgi:hypothetical protein